MKRYYRVQDKDISLPGLADYLMNGLVAAASVIVQTVLAVRVKKNR